MKADINPELPFLSFKKTQALLDCSRSFLYSQIKSGNIQPKYIGRKPYFLKEDLLRLFNGKK